MRIQANLLLDSGSKVFFLSSPVFAMNTQGLVSKYRVTLRFLCLGVLALHYSSVMLSLPS